MHFLVSNSRERGHDHVEPVKPRPALDEVKSGRADENDSQERQPDRTKIAKSFHKYGRWSPVVGKISFGQRPTTDYKTKGPPRMCGRPDVPVIKISPPSPSEASAWAFPPLSPVAHCCDAGHRRNK